MDAWTDPDLRSFLGVTAHFLMHDMPDGRLVMRSGLLAFQSIQGSHSSKNLANVLYKIVKDAGIEQRVCSFSNDSGVYG